MQRTASVGYWKDVIERLGDGNPAAYEDVYVCARCLDDEGLKGFVEGEATTKFCTFCGVKSDEPTAAPLVEVLLYIKECLEREYDFAENKLPREEGDYIGNVWTTRDLLEEHLGELPSALMDALCDGLGEHDWCTRHPFSLTVDERLSFSWNEFCDLVKHRRHYFFLREERQSDELYSPLSLLRELASWCERFDLIKPLPAGSPLYRVRQPKRDEVLSTAVDLGPPKNAKKSNRMNPPGIVMFYVSDSPETALREVAKNPATDTGVFVVGEFQTLRVATILDLTAIPPVPSIFESVPDTLEYDRRPPAIFLNYFSSDVSKPIADDDQIHVEYIPTQVITEYFRTEFLHAGRKIDGIRYRSARHSDHCSLVLFAIQDDLVGGSTSEAAGLHRTSDPWIELKNPPKQQHVTAGDVEQWNREAPPEIEWVG
jgi:hypothetical protein